MTIQTDRHTMTHVAAHADADEFHCPVCGRRVLLSWPPDYRREVLIAGDDAAVHTGGTGGVDGSVTVRDAGELPPADASARPEWLILDEEDE